MRKFPIALTALFMFGGAAHAQCTPEGMARHRAVIAQSNALIDFARTGVRKSTRLNSGEQSELPVVNSDRAVRCSEW